MLLKKQPPIVIARPAGRGKPGIAVKKTLLRFSMFLEKIPTFILLCFLLVMIALGFVVAVNWPSIYNQSVTAFCIRK